MASDFNVLNAREAAALLGTHVETVRRFARRGELPSFKVGKDWRFRREALVRWAEDQGIGGGRCSVIVVEDEKLVRKGLVKALERLGCFVRQAACGKEGLQLVQQETPDIILLDLVMPGMTGPQFLEKLRKTHPDLPVVIVTGYPDSEMVRDAAPFAPVMLLAKPIEPEQLDRTMHIVLGEKLTPASRRPAQ